MYANAFIHSRLKNYLQNFEVQVLLYNKTLEQNKPYVYEAIPVFIAISRNEFNDFLINYSPDLVAIHFVHWRMSKSFKYFKVPVFIWIHGEDATGWYRRLFNLSLKNCLGFLKYMLSNIRQMFFLQYLIHYSNKTGKIQFVFISKWIQMVTQKDTLSKVKNYQIIPNPIDETLFTYQAKEPELRKKILLIRSFKTKKYANDIAIKAIIILSKEDFFNDIEISIYGKGKYFLELTNKIKKFRNIKINNTFIENKNIPLVHKDHGIFLCPTRQDTQGVSMCEAMLSGLVPITSNNTAIPEFVNDKCAFLTRSPMDIAKAVKKLYFEPNLFIEMSKNASEHISSISGSKITIKNEISMLLNSL